MKLPILGLVLLALAACSSTPEDYQDPEQTSVGELVAQERYSEAVRVAARMVEEDPDDLRARESHRLASTAWHLAKGREEFYAGHFDLALESFEYAHELSPEVEQTGAWLEKMRDEIASAGLGEAVRLHALHELEEAVEHYETVLANRPDDQRAQQGLARALLQINYRLGLGEDYYGQGVRHLSDYLLWRARSKLGYADKYLDVDERVERRGHQVDGLLAEQRMARARGFEVEGQFAAARNEFRLALLLEPDHPEALEGFERSAREADAGMKLAEAELMILKERFDEAYLAIAEGRSLTLVQGEAFDALEDTIEDFRLRTQYERAIDLEADFRYPEAVEVYDTLLAEATYYEDAIARRDTLVSFIELAERLYSEMRAEQDLWERLALLRQIETFWPEYRDIQNRITQLSEELGVET